MSRRSLKSVCHRMEKRKKISLKLTLLILVVVSKEAQQSIFEPFLQGDRSITRKFGGTGLGLYIVRSLIAKMGGNMKITSQKEIGTHFQIVIPVKSVKRIHGRKKLHTSASIPFSCNGFDLDNALGDRVGKNIQQYLNKVLIVDDDIFNQNLLKEYFRKFNIECDTGGNGAEGLEKYQKGWEKYSFITMDIQMPGMDGITACKKIREFEKENNLKRIPIVIVTGNCSEDERRICLDNDEIEASYFFRKPFRLSDCKLCIEKILADVKQGRDFDD